MARPVPRGLIQIHVEGDDMLRPAVQTLFREWREALQRKYDFKIVMGDSNSETLGDWRREKSRIVSEATVLLLIDSEGPATAGDGSQIPPGVAGLLAREDMQAGDVYFMVQLMEAWFLTNPEATAEAFGKNFDRTALPDIPGGDRKTPAPEGECLESVDKDTILAALDKAARKTTRGGYDRTRGKTQVPPKIIRALDLHRIAHLSYHVRRLVQRLDQIVSDSTSTP